MPWVIAMTRLRLNNKHDRQLDFTDDVQHSRRRARIGLDQALACLEGNAFLLQPGDECRWDRRCERRRQAPVGKVHERAILGDHAVDEIEPPGDATQVVEAATGYEHDRNASTPRLGDGLSSWVYPAGHRV